MNDLQFNDLLDRYSDGSFSAADLIELKRLLATAHYRNLLDSYMQSKSAEAFEQPVTINGDEYLRMRSMVQARITTPVTPARMISMKWWRYAAAVVLIAGAAIYFITGKRQVSENNPVVINDQKMDVPAGTNRATLTLANGRIISLDSAQNGNLAIEGNSSVMKTTDGQLEYANYDKATTGAGATSGIEQNDRAVSWNTMSTPRGGQYRLRLPDGTNVMLNAASTITYPTSFAGRTREVRITGEAWFEVAKDASRPFLVRTPKELITVLGTSFNVNAYEDEPSQKTTLVEGRVKVDNVLLSPGQSCQDGKIAVADLRKETAWKNGAFHITDLSVPELMRQLSRWYDVAIVYESNISRQTYTGEIGRDLTLAEALKALNRLGVQCRYENHKIIMMQ